MVFAFELLSQIGERPLAVVFCEYRFVRKGSQLVTILSFAQGQEKGVELLIAL